MEIPVEEMVCMTISGSIFFIVLLHYNNYWGGANYTLTVSNNYAHNDWIEILVNQGILGIFVFFMYWKSFFRTAFRTNLDKTCSIVIKMIFIGYFAKTMFSMSYTDYNIMVNLCLGYCISRIDTTKSLTI